MTGERFLNPAYYRHHIDNKPIDASQIEALLDARLIDVALHNGRWWNIRRSGRTQRWKRSPERFRIPFKVGFYGHGALTEADLVTL